MRGSEDASRRVALSPFGEASYFLIQIQRQGRRGGRSKDATRSQMRGSEDASRRVALSPFGEASYFCRRPAISAISPHPPAAPQGELEASRRLQIPSRALEGAQTRSARARWSGGLST
ncbi:hypothetical protein CVT26_003808 [Gymnopilus dilepis]|uniref:Uncharacterized protein n=1 Tax=Gymnopilus dilepis TaxID=231916 RepID=A0A409YMA6_9AGAR|nr:hypothetical protein CVT26_003808 [Gymnopilus dilepis]